MIRSAITYSRFELTARAIIIRNGRILLFRMKGAHWYYYPGGHIEFRERAEDTLRREIREELGVSVRTASYIGTLENFFFENRYWHHALELVFIVSVSGNPQHAREDHEECAWVPLARYRTLDVRPRALTTAVLRWRTRRMPFWKTEQTPKK